MTEIVKAFYKWKSARMDSCCNDLTSSKSHWGRKRISSTRILPDGREVEGHYNDDFPLADAYVCERERAWRQYCTLRDSINYHIEPLNDSGK